MKQFLHYRNVGNALFMQAMQCTKCRFCCSSR